MLEILNIQRKLLESFNNLKIGYNTLRSFEWFIKQDKET